MWYHNEVVVVILFFLGLITGFIGTNTGGSVFITVPIMMYLDIPLISAVASARLASTGTMVAGLWQFHKSGKVDYKLACFSSLFGIFGSIAGALLLINIPEIILRKTIGFFLLFLLLLSLIHQKNKQKSNDEIKEVPRFKKILGYLSFLVIGAIGGFVGAQAKLATFVFQLLFNKSISQSVGTRKVSGLVISLTALFMYGVSGIVNWTFGIILVCGTLIGSSFGAAYALKKGDGWMQNLFNIVIIILALMMMFEEMWV